MASQATVIRAVLAERQAQDQKWGSDRKLHPMHWLTILAEEVGEACDGALSSPNDYGPMIDELIQAGALPPGDVDDRDIQDITARDLAGYTRHHFFAGIGGWPLALALAGWPDDRPVWTGSCPCQPFSDAGHRAGADDPRHLWPAWFALIQDYGPEFVFGEQVSGAVGLGWIDGVQTDLATKDYAVGFVILGAHSVDAPHRRQRLWFMAHAQGVDRRGMGAAGGNRPQPRSGRGLDNAPGDGAGRAAQTQPSRDRPDDRISGPSGQTDRGLGDALKSGHQKRISVGGVPQTGPGPSQGQTPWSTSSFVDCRDGRRRRTPEPESGVFPLADGVPVDMGSDSPGQASPFRVIRDDKGRSIGQSPWRTGMLQGYGNAIVPQVGSTFVRAVMEEFGL